MESHTSRADRRNERPAQTRGHIPKTGSIHPIWERSDRPDDRPQRPAGGGAGPITGDHESRRVIGKPVGYAEVKIWDAVE